MRQLLTPLHEQPGRNEQPLARQHRPLQPGKLVGRQAHDPASDDILRLLRLRYGHDAPLFQHGYDFHAGPHPLGQILDDRQGGSLLDGPQALGTVDVCLVARRVRRRRRRPAEQGVGFKVLHDRLGDGIADVVWIGGEGWVFVFGDDVHRARDERRQGNEVVAESLLGGDKQVPFYGYDAGKMRLAMGDAEDLLCRRTEGARVQ